MRRRVALSIAAAVIFGAGCDVPLVEVPADVPVVVRFQVAEALQPALLPVLEKVRAVQLEFSRDGAAAVDTVLPLRVIEGAAEVRVLVTPPSGTGALRVRAALEAEAGTVFAGEAVIPRGSVEAAGSIFVQPVPDQLTTPIRSFHLAALGEQVFIPSRVLFATTDTIPGLRGRLTSQDPRVAEVVDDSSAVSHANGETTLMLQYEELSLTVSVRVAQQPSYIAGIFPSDTTVFVGDTIRYRVQGLDLNGHPLTHGLDAHWVALGSTLEIDSLGVAVADSAGSGSVLIANTGAPPAMVTVLP